MKLTSSATIIHTKSIKHIIKIALLIVILLTVQLTLLISPASAIPTIVAMALPTGQVGSGYSTTLLAVSINGTTSWGLTSGTLPPGLTLTASTGTIIGTPTTAGTYTFFVMVTDSTGSSPQASFFITINPPPFTITTTELPSGKEGAAYSATLAATGGTAPYTWSIMSGSLPPGLTLSASGGYITGAVTRGSSGTFTVTVQVADSSSTIRYAQYTYSLYIEKGSYSPVITVGSGLLTGSTKVYVDGTVAATLKAGESVTLNLSLGISKNISVQPTVLDPSNSAIRYKAREESQTITESSPTATFNYDTEYYISLKTVPSLNLDPSGTGWYKKDSTMNTAATKESQAAVGTLYRFAYWLLPNNNKSTSENLNFTVDTPGVITAYYDTYYKLTIDSIYGETQGGGYYKTGSQVTWSVVNDRVPMQDLMGFFQGKYKATNPGGTVTLDGPKTVTVFWEPDYTMPGILIPLAILGVILAGVGLYFLMKRQQPRFAPMASMPPPAPMMGYPQPIPQAPPRPIPQQHTTVVMIENKGEPQKQLPGSTKEQLVEGFRQLLDKYETDIKGSLGAGTTESPRVEAPKEKMLEAPEFIPANVAGASGVSIEPDYVKEIKEPCGSSAKKLLRTVTGKWRQIESSTVSLPLKDENTKEAEMGLEVIWARDIYHEWDILKCTLPINHSGTHKGDSKIVLSLLNTVTIKSTYGTTQKVEPPSPHFTDSMPEIEPSEDEVIHAGDLPSETIK